MPQIHIYVAVDPVWSYNFLGGLKEHMELDTTIMDTLYCLSCRYVNERHRFVAQHGSNDGYNQALGVLNSELHNYPIPQSYFLYYWESLYRSIQVSLNCIHGFIQQVSPVCNDTGDVTGLVISIAKH